MSHCHEPSVCISVQGEANVGFGHQPALRFIHVEHQDRFLSDDQQMNTRAKLEHPAGGRGASRLSCLIRERLVVLLQGLPEAILQGSLDQ